VTFWVVAACAGGSFLFFSPFLMCDFFRNFSKSAFERFGLLSVSLTFLLSGFANADTAVISDESPNLNQGLIEGDLILNEFQNLNLNGGLRIEGVLKVPGTPEVRVQGGTVDAYQTGAGATTPTNHRVMINGGAYIQALETKSEVVALPVFEKPVSPSGNQRISLNSGQTVQDVSSYAHITLNHNYGDLVLPSGVYGDLIANGGTSFVLGKVGETTHYVVNKWHFNSNSELKVLGPVVIEVVKVNSGAHIKCGPRDGGSGNQAPVATAFNLAVQENTATAVVLEGIDPEGDALAYAITLQPLFGSLTGTAPNLVYTPNNGYEGSDLVKYTVSDGELVSDEVEVNITVEAVNDQPVATAQELSLNEDSSLAIVLSGVDSDGDVLTYAVVDSPNNGVLSGSAPNLLYTPNANFNGADQFTFKVNDGVLESVEVEVKITVVAVNDAPVFVDQNLQVVEDGNVSVVLSASDVDGDNLTYVVKEEPR